ncbi:MAG: hypothetical protein ACK53Y_00225, partial [bacterium]
LDPFFNGDLGPTEVLILDALLFFTKKATPRTPKIIKQIIPVKNIGGNAFDLDIATEFSDDLEESFLVMLLLLKP